MRKLKGFTLAELLVVIIILAVLTLAAVPLYMRSLDDARNASAKNMLSQIGNAYKNFRQAHNNMFLTCPSTALTNDDFGVAVTAENAVSSGHWDDVTLWKVEGAYIGTIERRGVSYRAPSSLKTLGFAGTLTPEDYDYEFFICDPTGADGSRPGFVAAGSGCGSPNACCRGREAYAAMRGTANSGQSYGTTYCAWVNIDGSISEVGL